MKNYKGFYREAKGDLPLIYCDMDGVLCDFVTAAERVTKVSWNRTRSERDWKPIKNTRNFWSTLPWKKDGTQLWNYIKKYKPSILSATVQAKTDPNCKPGKLKWLQKNLGLSDSSRINIVLRSQKKNYVMTSVGGKPAVLIDDYPKNIKEWTAKGGMGILHTTTSSTISQLRKIGF